MSSRRLSLLLLGAALLAASPTRADSRAWTAAKKVLPKGLTLLAGANSGTFERSQLYRLLVAQASAIAPRDKIKAACGFDPFTSVESIAVAGHGQQPELVVVAFKKLGKKELEPCIQKTDAKKLAVRWLSKDIAAVALDATQLANLTAGGFANDTVLAPIIGKISTDKPVWMVTSETKAVGDGSATMSAAYGTVTLAFPNMNIEFHVVLDSEKSAAATAAFGTTKIEEAKKHLPKAIPDALDHVTVRAVGSEVVIDGPFRDEDFMSLAMTMSVTP